MVNVKRLKGEEFEKLYTYYGLLNAYNPHIMTILLAVHNYPGTQILHLWGMLTKSGLSDSVSYPQFYRRMRDFEGVLWELKQDKPGSPVYVHISKNISDLTNGTNIGKIEAAMMIAVEDYFNEFQKMAPKISKRMVGFVDEVKKKTRVELEKELKFKKI